MVKKFLMISGLISVGVASMAQVPISVHEDQVFVTDLPASLNAVVNQALLDEIAKKCSPMKSATSIDVHVKLDRWVSGDTQAVDITGTAICSDK